MPFPVKKKSGIFLDLCRYRILLMYLKVFSNHKTKSIKQQIAQIKIKPLFNAHTLNKLWKFSDI